MIDVVKIGNRRVYLDIDDTDTLIYNDGTGEPHHGEFINRHECAELARVLQHFADTGKLPAPAKGE